MSAGTAALAAPAPRRTPLGPCLRMELAKLLGPRRTQVLLAVCWVAPAVCVAVISHQSSLPADTVFGRWLPTTGWAGPLVLLSFASGWVLPLLAALTAGEAFAAEDRLGTWRHLLIAVRSPGRIFQAKALAVLLVVLLLTAGLAASATLGGLLAVGDQPLAGLDGHRLSSGEAAVAVLLAWVGALAATLALAAVGLLGSVLLGRSPMGLLLPALLALLMQLAQLLPLPVAARMALPGYGFLAWRGLFTDPDQAGPLLVALAVDLAWTVVALVAACALFVRRDFTDSAEVGGTRRGLLLGVLPLVALLALSVGGLTLGGTDRAGGGIEAATLQRSVATVFAHLYRLQTAQLGRPAVTEADLRTSASCHRGGAGQLDLGPGHDWRCVVRWHLPHSGPSVGTALYQLDVAPDGRWTADGDGPKEVNGYFQVRTRTGDLPNPLWQVDGLVDLLHHSSKE